MVNDMMYRMDRETRKELALLWKEAERLQTNPETFCASYFSMTLDEFRTWIATGERPTEVA
jgi:hypothetical protein